MSHCDSNPLHPPPVGTFVTTSNGDAVETPLCDDCIRHRIDSALGNGEAFTVTTPVQVATPRRRVIRESRCWT